MQVRKNESSYYETKFQRDQIVFHTAKYECAAEPEWKKPASEGEIKRRGKRRVRAKA